MEFEERVPARHPLRKIKAVVKGALASLDADFAHLYAGERSQVECLVAVGESTDQFRPSLNFAQDALQGVVGSNASPMLFRTVDLDILPGWGTFCRYRHEMAVAAQIADMIGGKTDWLTPRR